MLLQSPLEHLERFKDAIRLSVVFDLFEYRIYFLLKKEVIIQLHPDSTSCIRLSSSAASMISSGFSASSYP